LKFQIRCWMMRIKKIEFVTGFILEALNTYGELTVNGLVTLWKEWRNGGTKMFPAFLTVKSCIRSLTIGQISNYLNILKRQGKVTYRREKNHVTYWCLTHSETNSGVG